MYKLSTFLLSAVLGLLLGDSSLELDVSNRSKNARFYLQQSIIHIQFLLFVFTLLAPYCSSIPSPKVSHKDGKTQTHYGAEVRTRALPAFTQLYYAFYPNGVKILPVSLIIYLDEDCLAYWIMSDASYGLKKEIRVGHMY